MMASSLPWPAFARQCTVKGEFRKPPFPQRRLAPGRRPGRSPPPSDPLMEPTAPVPKPPRILSGVQPSGKLHLGNYFGAIKQHIALQDQGECFYFIANYHTLTTIRDTAARLAEETKRPLSAANLLR